jgi:hypothetical protein
MRRLPAMGIHDKPIALARLDKKGLSQRPSSSLQSDVLLTMIAPPKSRPADRHRLYESMLRSEDAADRKQVESGCPDIVTYPKGVCT